MRAKGARFVEKVSDIPKDAVTVFSAHGVSRKVEDAADARGLQVIDATCPLVSKVHVEAQRYAHQGYEVVLIGHSGHPEVEGTMGQVPGTVHLVSNLSDVAALAPADPEKLSYVTQTTLSVDDTREIIAALKSRFPAIRGPDVKDICYATQNRQTAVRLLAAESDVILVIGADYSSNSNRLREIGTRSEPTATSSPMPGAWIRPGWTGRRPWASPRGPRPRKSWCRGWWTGSATCTTLPWPTSTASRRTSPSSCRGSWARPSRARRPAPPHRLSPLEIVDQVQLDEAVPPGRVGGAVRPVHRQEEEALKVQRPVVREAAVELDEQRTRGMPGVR